MTTTRTWSIVVAEARTPSGSYSPKYLVYLEGDEWVGTWRTPLLSAARHILEHYDADPSDVITMRRQGRTTIDMHGTLGEAAKLTVQEGEITGPRFRPHDASIGSRLKAPAAGKTSGVHGYPETVPAAGEPDVYENLGAAE